MKLEDVKGTIRCVQNKLIKKPKKHKSTDFDIELIREYFKDVNYRGLYYVTIKQEVVKYLRKNQYTFYEIADIMDIHYTSAIHLSNTRKKDLENIGMKNEWKKMITHKKYPITTYNTEMDKKTYTQTTKRNVVLIDRKDIFHYICTKPINK